MARLRGLTIRTPAPEAEPTSVILTFGNLTESQVDVIASLPEGAPTAQPDEAESWQLYRAITPFGNPTTNQENWVAEAYADSGTAEGATWLARTPSAFYIARYLLDVEWTPWSDIYQTSAP